MKLLKATLFLQFAREPLRLCLHQVTDIQWWGLSSPPLWSPILSLDCRFCLNAPAQFPIAWNHPLYSKWLKNLHILCLYITLRKKMHIFSTWDVHIVRHVAAQNSSLPCAVWICFKTHIKWRSNCISDKVN